MNNLSMGERAALRLALSELQTLRDLYGEAVNRLERTIADLESHTIVALPVTVEQPPLEEQPLQSRSSPKAKIHRSNYNMTLIGERQGAVAESERRAIALEISEYCKKHPDKTFWPKDLLTVSPTAVRRYPNVDSRKACISNILRKSGSKFGVKNVGEGFYAEWAYIPK
jgi:hypothetical protein